MPMLELEEEDPAQFHRSLAHRWAQRQLHIMKTEKVGEKTAYERCVVEYAPEVKAHEAKLDAICADGARRLSFNSIKKNASQFARLSVTISKMLEARIDVNENNALFTSPLDYPQDTRQRRRAKLQRLAQDPTIAYVKGLFVPEKPAALRALEVLIKSPDSVDVAFYNEELRGFLQTLTKRTNNFDESKSVEAEAEQVRELKKLLSGVTQKLKQSSFAKLPKELKLQVIGAVQLGLKLKLVREKEVASGRAQSFSGEAQGRVKDLQKNLAGERSERNMRDVIGDENFAYFKEMQWWRTSDQRKKMYEYMKKAGAHPRITDTMD
jgi:hypothetical protein